MKFSFYLLLACVVFTACGESGKTTADYRIVPRPGEIAPGDGGDFELDARTRIVCTGDGDGMRANAEFLAGYVESVIGSAPEITGPDGLCDDGRAVILRADAPGKGGEAYEIEISENRITVSGESDAGVFYGIQTLRKAMGAAKAAKVLFPAVRIADEPYLGYRGVMLDVGRTFYPVEEVKRIIDLAALHNLNVFHWHLTDDQGWRIEIKKYPELTRVGSVRGETLIGHHHTSSEYDKTPHGGYYTQKQIREIVKYAADRYVTVIPEIELPGHAVAALTSYPWLGCKGEGYEVRRRWGISKEVFCPGKETTFEFLQNVFAEVLELFPSEFIHIGGDECPKDSWKQCPLCQERIRTEGLKDEFELQSYTVRRMEKWLREHGRKIIGWDEILEGGVSPTATVMSWRGSKGGIAAAKAGNHVIMAPNVHCYLDYYQTKTPAKEPMAIGGYVPMRKVYELDPYDQLTPGERAYILGVQGNLWTEYIATFPHLKHMLLPRLAAIAEVGWSYDRKDFDDFKHRMNSLRKCYDAAGLNYATYFFEGKDE